MPVACSLPPCRRRVGYALKRRRLAMKLGRCVMAGSTRETVRKVQEAWNEDRLDHLDQYFAPHFAAHPNEPRGWPGPAGAKAAHPLPHQVFSERTEHLSECHAC